MRIHFQEQPWDIYVLIGYTVVMGGMLLGLGAPNILAVALDLLVPGYVLVAALFPRNKEIDWIERIALTFGLSLASVPLLGLALSLTPLGIRSIPVAALLVAFSIVVGAVAYWRRVRLPVAERLSGTVQLTLPGLKGDSLLEKVLTIAIAAIVFMAAGTLAYLIVTPRSGERFTEFYLVGPGGNASGYPSALNVSQPGTLILGIANHEAASVNYSVRIDLVGVRIVYNATSRSNETVEVNRTTWSWFNVTLDNGQNSAQPYTFRINSTGLWKIQFLLYKDTDLIAPYRELHLFVRVG